MEIHTFKQFIPLVFLGAIALFATQTEWWILIALLGVVLLSILILLDTFFFKSDVYLNADEPTAISGVMQFAPWVLFPFVATEFSSLSITASALTSGALSMAGFWLYFRAMRDDHDAVVISIMWNLMIALVPLIAYVAIDERLSGLQYVAIALIFTGAFLGSYEKAKAKSDVIVRMFCAVVLLSVSTVIIKGVFNELMASGNPSVFWSGYLPHVAGCGLVGLLFLGKISSHYTTRMHFGRLLKRFWVIFLLIEGVQIGADGLLTLASSVGNVSIVTAMDGLMGIVAAGLSVIFMYATFLFKSPHGLKKSAIKFTGEQFTNFGLKITGMSLITLGAYLIV